MPSGGVGSGASTGAIAGSMGAIAGSTGAIAGSTGAIAGSAGAGAGGGGRRKANGSGAGGGTATSPAVAATGAAGGGGGGGINGFPGSADAGAAAHMNAAISPAAPTDTAVAAMSILTDNPFPHSDPKSIYRVLQFDCRNCYTCARCDQAVNNSDGIGTRFTSEYL